VIAVCSTANTELVEALGADEVVDYTREDFSRQVRDCDLVVDAVGNRSLADLRRVLKPDGTLVLLGGGHGRLLGPLAQIAIAAVLGRFGRRQMRSFLARPRKDDLLKLSQMSEAGQITPVIDRVYSLSQAVEAISTSRPAMPAARSL
jgi:NADPH:quinone reductase-like Zn-dependent oxidoreductase